MPTGYQITKSGTISYCISGSDEMDISSQPAGVYFLRIIFDRNQVSVWKIIKE